MIGMTKNEGEPATHIEIVYAANGPEDVEDKNCDGDDNAGDASEDGTGLLTEHHRQCGRAGLDAPTNEVGPDSVGDIAKTTQSTGRGEIPELRILFFGRIGFRLGGNIRIGWLVAHLFFSPVVFGNKSMLRQPG